MLVEYTKCAGPPTAASSVQGARIGMLLLCSSRFYCFCFDYILFQFSTIKLWDVRNPMKLLSDLPGHSDEVCTHTRAHTHTHTQFEEFDGWMTYDWWRWWNCLTPGSIKYAYKIQIPLLKQVYAVDWSPDGLFVASGGKDRVLKL